MPVTVIHGKLKIRASGQAFRHLCRRLCPQHLIVHGAGQQNRAGDITQCIQIIKTFHPFRKDGKAIQFLGGHCFCGLDQIIPNLPEYLLRIDRLSERQIQRFRISGLRQLNPRIDCLILFFRYTGGGGAENQLLDKIRIVDCDIHCDHTALGNAHQIDMIQTQRSEGLCGVLCHFMHGICGGHFFSPVK